MKTKAQPNSNEAHILKKIHFICNELWNQIHILSEMEINENSYLLKIVVGISSLLCITSREFNSFLSDFYTELNLSYVQLEGELIKLLKIEKVGQIKEKNNKKRVIVTE